MTMFGLYVFCLAVGGGFLALSLFGDVLDAEVEVGGDVDVDLDGGSGAFAKLFSLRAVVYAMFGFGATGVALTLGWGEDRGLTTLLAASATGVLSGVLISAILNYVRRTSSGERLGEASFVGLPAEVTLAIESGTPGAVSVHRGDRRYSLRAVLHNGQGVAGQGPPLRIGQAVVVTEMAGGLAYVTPVDPGLLDAGT